MKENKIWMIVWDQYYSIYGDNPDAYPNIMNKKRSMKAFDNKEELLTFIGNVCGQLFRDDEGIVKIFTVDESEKIEHYKITWDNKLKIELVE